MASSSCALQTQLRTASVFPGWKIDDITESAIQKLLVQKFTEIVASYDHRRQTNDLEIGPWYPEDYALALQKNNQEARRKDLIGSQPFFNAFVNGYAPEGFCRALVVKIDNESPSSSRFETPPCSYMIQKECLPSAGLDSIRNGRYCFFDCQGAIQIALYETIHEIFGTALFDKTFAHGGRNPMQIGTDINDTPLVKLKLVKDITIDFQNPQLEPGDLICYRNHNLYLNKHIRGDMSNLNTLCISTQDVAGPKFIGFGTSPEGMTSDQVADFLMAEFNSKPIDLSLMLSEEKVASLQEEISVQRGMIDFCLKYGGLTLEDGTEKVTKEAFKEITTIFTRGNPAGYVSSGKRLDFYQISALKFQHEFWSPNS